MAAPRAQRTLVKSRPELWAEVSDDSALAEHLGVFGEIRITRREPETTVAWEGDRARGTVELEPSGWGTRVTLTARLARNNAQAAIEPEIDAAEPPAADAIDAPPATRRGLLLRLFRRLRPAATPATAESEPRPVERAAPPADAVAAQPAPSAEEEPAPLDAGRAEEVLVRVLDDLGAARHRPFSRG